MAKHVLVRMIVVLTFAISFWTVATQAQTTEPSMRAYNFSRKGQASARRRAARKIRAEAIAAANRAARQRRNRGAASHTRRRVNTTPTGPQIVIDGPTNLVRNPGDSITFTAKVVDEKGEVSLATFDTDKGLSNNKVLAEVGLNNGEFSATTVDVGRTTITFGSEEFPKLKKVVRLTVNEPQLQSIGFGTGNDNVTWGGPGKGYHEFDVEAWVPNGTAITASLVATTSNKAVLVSWPEAKSGDPMKLRLTLNTKLENLKEDLVLKIKVRQNNSEVESEMTVTLPAIQSDESSARDSSETPNESSDNSSGDGNDDGAGDGGGEDGDRGRGQDRGNGQGNGSTVPPADQNDVTKKKAKSNV